MDREKSHNDGGVAPNQERRRRLRAIHPAARLLALPVIAAVVLHTMIIALWVAPMTPAREQLGNDNVRSYVMPWFEQNWSIFAPNPKSTAVGFEVRAAYEDGAGQIITSDWTDLTQVEDEIISGNPMGSRASNITRRIVGRIHSARSHMNDDQLEWIEANFFVTPIDELRSNLLTVNGGTGQYQVDRYLKADAAASYLATAVTELYDPAEIIRVQYRTSTRSLPSWEERHEKDFEDQTPSYRDYGWRAPADISEDDLKYFEDYLDGIPSLEQGT